MASAHNEKLTLNGVVKGFTFRDEDSGFFIARVEIAGAEQVVTGYAAQISAGEYLTAKGEWHKTNYPPQYRQFKASDITLKQPTALAHIEKYLASSVSGIGKEFARKLVAALGDKVFDTIENHPEKLREIPGVGPKKAASLVEAYEKQRNVRKTLTFLFKVGLTPGRAQRVLAFFGDSAVEKIEENPYSLCGIWGIGFKTADEAAQLQGIAPDSEFRVRAGIAHILKVAEDHGSCGLPTTQLLEKCGELLGVGYDRIEECLVFEERAKGVARDKAAGEECIFLRDVYEAEKDIAKRLVSHAMSPVAWPIQNLEDVLFATEMELDIMLDSVQREAVRMALSNQLCVITGGPGTGKTTITRVILTALHHAQQSIGLATPTGKSAKRANEATGFPASTMHRLLEVGAQGKFKRNSQNPLDYQVLSLDEQSMVDVDMFLSLLQATRTSTRLILIGDKDQLPSVGAGKVLADIIDSGVLPIVKLKQVFRQGKRSRISIAAHAVNSGEMPSAGFEKDSDFGFIAMNPKEKTDEGKRKCREAIEQTLLLHARDAYKLGFDPIKDVQVLAPMKKGLLGTISLNQKLRLLLNPNPSATVKVREETWGVGDKVIQRKNAYNRGKSGVYNGDIGFITAIDSNERTLTVDFGTGPVVYKWSELDELELAFAITIHKSQGSEFPVVLMPIENSHFTMLRRNLVYTGITRARKLMLMFGNSSAVRMAVESSQVDERYSKLKEWLRLEAAQRNYVAPVYQPAA